jgi:hypothetical protein
VIAIPTADPTTEPCRAVPDVVLRREVCQAHGVGWPCAEPAELEREVRVMRGRILIADVRSALTAEVAS